MMMMIFVFGITMSRHATRRPDVGQFLELILRLLDCVLKSSCSGTRCYWKAGGV
jgi:hypothetical protein